MENSHVEVLLLAFYFTILRFLIGGNGTQSRKALHIMKPKRT